MNKKLQGFTLIELIIYLAIVAIILTTISYLILDILGGQTKNYANQEINQNLRLITGILVKDIKAAEEIVSLDSKTLILRADGDDITFNFDDSNQDITKQIGAGQTARLNSSRVEVSGSFTDLSYDDRTKNVGISLLFNYYNPSGMADYNASTTVDFTVELRGRK
ncbi:MAG: prepilin-type N-terminal cleavage/methylation domain-containing protein [Patescibacteria group bacterium]|jgi:prepilin-type N-terminal cleavage/methylation domain-containing protein|nr:prepilin-type N-terminal cleavage/methylation domain-containing protein [Patescibacteria group bacterium]